MRSLLLSSFLFLSAASAGLLKRDSSDQVCTDLSVSSNNGDRKVAVVIDSSGSMAYNDPYELRLVAGRALNNFLISTAEATADKKADQIAVIDFSDEATVDYPLGDPGSANSSFSKIGETGGTYIAEGVLTGIKQLTGAASGSTDKRSAIVVFTDGEVRCLLLNGSLKRVLYSLVNDEC